MISITNWKERNSKSRRFILVLHHSRSELNGVVREGTRPPHMEPKWSDRTYTKKGKKKDSSLTASKGCGYS